MNDLVFLVEPDEKKFLNEENMTELLSEFTHQKEDRDKSILYTRVEVDWPLEWLKVILHLHISILMLRFNFWAQFHKTSFGNDLLK